MVIPIGHGYIQTTYGRLLTTISFDGGWPATITFLEQQGFVVVPK